MVILTDGNADDNISTISQLLKAQGTKVVAVGVGNVEYDQLEVLAGGDSTNILHVSDFDELASNINFLRDAICKPSY
eukprot:scaffold71221_cov39-Prasinocladus_malaysianus.AAC.2